MNHTDIPGAIDRLLVFDYSMQQFVEHIYHQAFKVGFMMAQRARQLEIPASENNASISKKLGSLLYHGTLLFSRTINKRQYSNMTDDFYKHLTYHFWHYFKEEEHIEQLSNAFSSPPIEENEEFYHALSNLFDAEHTEVLASVGGISSQDLLKKLLTTYLQFG